MRTKQHIDRLVRRVTHRGSRRRRYDVVNYFAARRGYRTYLEIGVGSGRCLARVCMPEKIGVDPDPKAVETDWRLQKVTSDEFFETNRQTFDLILVDGLHFAEQVLRDVHNGLQVLNRGGAVLMHDCNPPNEWAQRREIDPAERRRWNGDTWKAMVFLRRNYPGLFTRVLNLDFGVGVVVPRDYENPPVLNGDFERADTLFAELSYQDLDSDRNGMLGLVRDPVDVEKELVSAGIW